MIATMQIKYLLRPYRNPQLGWVHEWNTKLIWENDVVKDKHGNFYKAFWQDNYYQFSWICIKSDNKLFIEVKWNLWSIKNFEIEVIGNIFDDKELEKGE